MYIKFKSKYKKIFWILLGFILSCIYVHKVYALPTTTYHGYTITDNTYDRIWAYFEGKTLHEINNSINSNEVIHRADFPYVAIKYYEDTSTKQISFAFLKEYHINCPGTNVLSGSSSGEVRFFCNQNSPYFNQYWISAYINTVNDTIMYPDAYNSIWIAQVRNYRNNYKGLYNFDVKTVSNTVALEKNYEYTVETLPSYLNGYKKITLTTEDKYYMLSGLSSGSVYIPTQAFLDYGGRLSYYDNDLDSQPYTSYIQDYYNMPDDEFVRQDFNLSSYPGADWVMFSKYIYLEGQDNISYDIWVPDVIYDSQVTITPNPATGGNDFDFEYKDSNGDIQSEQVQSVDLSEDSPLLGNIFSSFSSNTFGLTSIITAPLSLISSLSSSSCSTLTVPLPFINSNLTLPCMNTVYSNTFGSFFTLYQTITTGIIAYWVIVKIFNLVKDFKNPDHDEIEVVDL